MSTRVMPERGTAGSTARPRKQRSRFRIALSRADVKYSPYAFVLPFFVIFGVFGLFPLLYTLWVSLHDWELVGDRRFIGVHNYVDLAADPQFWNSVLNTLGMFIVATVPQLLLALVLAAVLNRRLRMSTLFRMGVLVPNITAAAAVAIIFSLIFARDFGFANWLLGHLGVDAIDWTAHKWSSWLAISVMVDWRWTGYNALIFLAAMQTIPKDIYEAAAIDGAGAWRQFWSITIPMLRPTLIFVVTVSTIGGIQLFTEPLLFGQGANAIVGGTLRQYQTVAMYLVENAFFRFDFGYGAAVAWMLFLLIAVASAINFVIMSRVRSGD